MMMRFSGALERILREFRTEVQNKVLLFADFDWRFDRI
jgi:hypothetical protein